MRKIEQEMRQAIQQGRSWSQGNTTVRIEGDSAHVFLHGNHIGQVDRGNGRITVDESTLRFFPTVTTKSRLRALGVNLTQSKGRIYIDGRYICKAR